MSGTAIRIDQVSKRYQLGRRRASGDGLRHAIHDALGRSARRLLGRATSPEEESSAEFWALKDVSFEVQPGEVVGVIGRNGAGKSTLLKILSRITEPSHGRIEIEGRVASLLEVGTGFHPELTGRENIYLNGAILGMSRREIQGKLDEIIAFAEVEQFLETPVKRYSSGMYVRLAFAVAAHLEPEVLIVDEVLAVGDAEFQKKCLGKMREVSSKQGRTILFVSHNLGAVTSLCRRAVHLHAGRLVADGEASSVIARYLETKGDTGGEVRWLVLDEAPGNDRVRIRSIAVRVDGQITSKVKASDAVTISVEFEVLRSGLQLNAYLILMDSMGTEVLCALNVPSAVREPDPMVFAALERGLYRTECTLPPDLLNELQYSVKAGFNSNLTHHEFRTDEVISFRVMRSDAMRSEYFGEWPGVVRPRLEWRTLGPADAPAQ